MGEDIGRREGGGGGGVGTNWRQVAPDPVPGRRHAQRQTQNPFGDQPRQLEGDHPACARPIDNKGRGTKESQR